MRYAMIPINRRYNDDGRRVVRRVLISYKYKTLNGEYKDTKIIEKDPYFKDPNSSQQYVFENNYFIHTEDRYNLGDQKCLLNTKRSYMFNEGLLDNNAIEFTAKTEEEAIEKFNNREELH